MLYLNIQDRKLPKGIFFGKDTRSTILQIDSDFAKVKHYGIETALMRIEVYKINKLVFRRRHITLYKLD